MLFEALASGGGSDWYYTVLLKAPLGADITLDDGDEEVTAVGAGTDTIIGIPVHNASSAYTVSVEMDGFTKSGGTVNTPVQSGGILNPPIEVKFGHIELTFDDEFRGQPATLTDQTLSTTITLPSTGNTLDLYVPNGGEWTISSTDPSTSLPYEGKCTVPANLSGDTPLYLYMIPEGATVLPINDIETWLLCADIKNTGYTTLAEVLADEDVLFKLLTDDNANDYLKRSTKFAKRAEVPILSADSDKIYKAGQTFANGYEAWKAFDGNDSTGAVLNQSNTVAYLGYIFDDVEEIVKVTVSAGTSFSTQHVIEYSDDGTDWTLCSDTATTTAEKQLATLNINSGTGSHRYWRMKRTTASAGSGVCFSLQFYGEGITDNELAMQIIGADDYASDTLLSDATWKSAIINSEYTEDVLNITVPAMTDATHPEGEVFGDSPYEGNIYYVFDRNDANSHYWLKGGPTYGTTKIGYKFVDAHKIIGILTKNLSTDGSNLQWTTATFDLKGSNDGTNWTTIGSLLTIPDTSALAVNKFVIQNNTEYQYYAVFPMSNKAGNASYVGIHSIQFYGREAGGVQTLLKAAGITKPYTTIDELLADHVSLQKVISSHDAIDYLVTAKYFIDAITSDATAMRYIGKRNYAADTLLDDEEWLEGICGSEYFESVLNAKVPIMTGESTPSGRATAISSGTYSGVTHYPYMAFNQSSLSDYESRWEDNGETTNAWIQYEFDSPVKIYLAYFRAMHAGGSQKTRVKNYKMIGSNDDFVSDTHDLTEDLLCPDEKESSYLCGILQKVIFTKNIDDYKTYRMFIYDAWSNNIGVKMLQFYGRTDVDETKIDLVSAANDTVYYLNGGTQVPVGTTSTDGMGEVDASDLPADDEYVLYSTAADDPNNLSNHYSKKVHIYDGMISIEVLPDGALYWYGFKGDIETLSTANGWTPYTNYSFVDPTYDTRKVTEASSTNNTVGVGTKKPVTGTIKAISESGSSSQSGDYKYYISLFSINSGKNMTSGENALANLNSPNPIPKTLHALKDVSGLYVAHYTGNARTSYMHSLWNAGQPTYISAANDTLYILDGATQIPIAHTDENGYSYDPILEPGTYDIYSSVAKDPSDLTKPFKVHVRILGYTKCIKLIPDVPLLIYWYGYNMPPIDSTTKMWSNYTQLGQAIIDNGTYLTLKSAPSSASNSSEYETIFNQWVTPSNVSKMKLIIEDTQMLDSSVDGTVGRNVLPSNTPCRFGAQPLKAGAGQLGRNIGLSSYSTSNQDPWFNVFSWTPYNATVELKINAIWLE